MSTIITPSSSPARTVIHVSTFTDDGMYKCKLNEILDKTVTKKRKNSIQDLEKNAILLIDMNSVGEIRMNPANIVDFTIVYLNQRFRVHKQIMCLKSKKFQEIIKSKEKFQDDDDDSNTYVHNIEFPINNPNNSGYILHLYTNAILFA
jgi:hypothetical protein